MQIGESKPLEVWIPELKAKVNYKSMMVITVNRTDFLVNQAVIRLRQLLEDSEGKAQVFDSEFLQIGNLYKDQLLYLVERVDFDYILSAYSDPGAALLKQYSHIVKGRTSVNLKTTTMINGHLSNDIPFPLASLTKSVPRSYHDFHEVVLREEPKEANKFTLLKCKGL